MTYDTLTYNGTEKKFTDWGFESSIRGRKVNQSADDFEATIALSSIADETAAPTFPFEAGVIVQVNRASSTGAPGSFSGGTIKFQGKRVGWPMKADHSGQGVTYKFHGPWYDLEQTHYQQSFLGGGNQVYPVAETILFTSRAGNFASANLVELISVGDQIQAIAQWLLDQYANQNMPAPFQYKGRLLNTTTVAPDQTGVVATGAIDLRYHVAGVVVVYNYALDGAATIDPTLFTCFLPSFITKPLMCSDAIQKCLELFPRANVWFDHATTPPTLHVTLPEHKRAVTLPLFDGISHEKLDIHRRDDLFVRAVNIGYRITSQVSGSNKIDYAFDQWGPHGSNSYWSIYYASGPNAANAAVKAGTADPITGLRVVNELIDLQGYNAVLSTGHLDCEPVLATVAAGGTTQALKRGWWASKRGGDLAKAEDLRCRFQDKGGAQTTIPDAGVYDAATGAAISLADYPNRIVRGTHHAWMQLPDLTPVVSIKAKVMAKMEYSVYDTTGSSDTDTSGRQLSHSASEDHHVNIELTNGVTGTYSTLTSLTPGETYIIGPGGIAQFLFNHLNAYQYDGDAIHVAASFAPATGNPLPTVDLGCALNLSGSAAEWLSMGAQIQEIEEDYFHHKTVVKIGVAKHLNAGQLSSILNMWRNRRTWYNPNIRSDNSQISQSVDQPVTAGNADNVQGLAVESQRATSSPDATNTGVTNTVTHDASTGQTHVIQSDTTTNANLVTALALTEIALALGGVMPSSANLP